MYRSRVRSLAALSIIAFHSALLPSSAAQSLREPLPVEVALSLRGHNGRSSFELSPDGAWLAHTIQSVDRVERAAGRWSETGFPFAEGNARMEATLSATDGEGAVRLGSLEASSWAPTFSPDGARVAYYSDEGGEAGLWVQEVARGRSRRVKELIVRPFFGFEIPRWSPDGRRILLKILPEGVTVTEANARGSRGSGRDSGRFPEVDPDDPSVLVRRVESPTAAEPAAEDQDDPIRQRPPEGDLSGIEADLALVDIESGAVRRLVTATPLRDYAFSPDGRSVAYTVLTGYERATQQPNFDLWMLDLEAGDARRLADNIRLSYGIEWSWSPDGHHLAWTPSGQMAERAAAAGDPVRMVTVAVADGARVDLGTAETPSFGAGEGELPPFWSADGATLYGVGDGALWRIDRASGRVERVAETPGWRVSAPVHHRGSGILWSAPGSVEIWVMGREIDGPRSGFWAFDPASGSARLAHAEPKGYSGVFSIDGADGSGDIAFAATGLQEPYDLWLLDTATGTSRQVSHLNPELERYELGDATVIDWRSLHGEPLQGALLLPPGYEPGTRLPLVVWVYAGAMGSDYVNRFGLWGSMATFNMHLLATRGYAVLAPDAPIRVGYPLDDLMATVMPGVNAAIAGGWADPERLAVMGQSYGSYNTLGIISRTNRFKAAVITAAVLHPDLFADYLGGSGYYEQGQGNMGGSIWEVPERYRANSPLFDFDKIETPLLIGQGENDGDLVPAEAIFAAFERLGKPVEYRLYEGEGHVLSGHANVIDFWNRRFEFLAEHLALEVDASGRIR